MNHNKKDRTNKVILIILACILGFIILSVLTFMKSNAQTKQKKIKYDTIIVDSSKFVRYYIIKKDTVKIDTLSKTDQHIIRIQQELKKIKK